MIQLFGSLSMNVKLVAELGINHNGDLLLAKRLIDVAKFAGCHYVKFQKRDIDLVYAEEELNKPRESPWGSTQREQKQGLEFEKRDYDFMAEYCSQIGIQWFISPWDVNSVDFLMQYKPPFIKIPSALITNTELVEAVKATEVPVIISTGMSTEEEVGNCCTLLGGRLIYILACTSTYPTPDAEMNLKFILKLKKEFPQYKIGFSNHSPGIQYLIIAAAYGAEMLEFHITMDRAMYGSGQAASIEMQGVLQIVKHVSNVERAMGSGEWKVYPSEEKIKEKLRR